MVIDFQYYNRLATIYWVQNANLADDGWYPETAAGVLGEKYTQFVDYKFSYF